MAQRLSRPQLAERILRRYGHWPAAIDLFADPSILDAARAEFAEKTAEGYTCPIPADAVPTIAD